MCFVPGQIRFMADDISVEVVYVSSNSAFQKALTLDDSATVSTAIEASGVYDCCPELSRPVEKVGIYGKLVEPGQQLRDGDRIELYRPLLIDPKQARRERAERKKLLKGG